MFINTINSSLIISSINTMFKYRNKKTLLLFITLTKNINGIIQTSEY